ncbi:MAG: entericidin [Prevotella sp.]|nr:entericidin [Prevotella sp.]
MKKLVLAFVAVAAISFASCGNTQKPAQNADTTKVDTAQVDTAQVDTAAAAADTTAQK